MSNSRVLELVGLGDFLVFHFHLAAYFSEVATLSESWLIYRMYLLGISVSRANGHPIIVIPCFLYRLLFNNL